MLSRYQQEPFVLRRFSSPAKMKELLDNLVRHEVMALEALKRGYDRDPEVLRIMKERMVKQFTKREITDKIKPTDIPEQEIRAYYQAHTQDFYRPEEIRVSQILVRDKAKAQQIIALAHAIPGQNLKGFRDLAMQYSEDDDSKARGGDLMFFSRNNTRLPVAVENAAFAMRQIGELVGPMETEQGFVILKLTDRRLARVLSLEESKVEIQTRLAETYRSQRLKALVDEAKRNVQVKIYEEVLASLPDFSRSPLPTHSPFHRPSSTPDAGSDPRRFE
jgi:peptidyl-prolyl cis-trans isomerase C